MEARCDIADDPAPANPGVCAASLDSDACRETDAVGLQADAVNRCQIAPLQSDGLTIDANTLAVRVDASLSGPMAPGLDCVDFVGAVDPEAAEPFWTEWTVRDGRFDGNLPGPDFHPLQAEIESSDLAGAEANACAAINPDFTPMGSQMVFGANFPVCLVDENILEDTTLRADHLYFFSRAVFVGDGSFAEIDAPLSVTLTVEPGTQVLFREGAGLIVSPDARIEATGTRARPIVMSGAESDEPPTRLTSDPTDLNDRGAWTGLVMLGNARTNPNADPVRDIGLVFPDMVLDPQLLNGSDDGDDSGTLQYVVIAEAGGSFGTLGVLSPGLFMGGVGTGTEVDHVQIVSEFDCVGISGGTVGVEHLVCNGPDDDGVDIDDGYRGRIQYGLIRMGPINGHRGIETDGAFDAQPRTAPTLAHITVLGNVGQPRETTIGILHRRGDASRVYRSAFVDDTPAGGAFEGGCVDIDDTLPPGLQHVDVVYQCSGGDALGLALPDDMP